MCESARRRKHLGGAAAIPAAAATAQHAAERAAEAAGKAAAAAAGVAAAAAAGHAGHLTDKAEQLLAGRLVGRGGSKVVLDCAEDLVVRHVLQATGMSRFLLLGATFNPVDVHALPGCQLIL